MWTYMEKNHSPVTLLEGCDNMNMEQYLEQELIAEFVLEIPPVNCWNFEATEEKLKIPQSVVRETKSWNRYVRLQRSNGSHLAPNPDCLS